MGKPRIIITTDISSCRAGFKEADDCQSLVRLFAMSNCYDIEGLIASSRLSHGQDVAPEHIRAILAAYYQARPNLTKHATGYPQVRPLYQLVKAGQPIAAPTLPIEASIGEKEDTQASNHIIHALKRKDPRPLWILAWGGTADLAQALWRIRESFPAATAKALRKKLRVYAIGDQDSTGPWIRQQFPDLWYILARRSFRGMYRFGDPSLCDLAWVRENITESHGPLGGAYPEYDGNDLFSSTLGKVRGVKEADSPSFLYLTNNGLNEPDRPQLGGWGGRFLPSPDNPRHFLDAADDLPATSDDLVRTAATVYRWRSAIQNEFAARMDWCLREKDQASHPPLVKLAGLPKRRIAPGKSLLLDLSASRSAGGGAVIVRWYEYPANPAAKVEFENPASPRTRLTVQGPKGATLHLVGEVTGSGDPPLTRYARVELTLK